MKATNEANPILEWIKKVFYTIRAWFTPIRLLAITLIVLTLSIGIIGYTTTHDEWNIRALLEDFYANVSAELGSILLTILVIDALNERRSKEQEKRRLILQMGSSDNAFAGEAARLLRTEGWLKDGSLKRANLWGSNLEGANLGSSNLEGATLRDAKLSGAYLGHANLARAQLENANLEGAHLLSVSFEEARLGIANLKEADLLEANLKGANLWEANLEMACLERANLEGANLEGANLEGANLERANLKGANLERANLKGANLWEANLEGANLKKANLEGATLEGATLPNKTKLPGRARMERHIYDEPDWHTPFRAWDKAGRPKNKATYDYSDGDWTPSF